MAGSFRFAFPLVFAAFFLPRAEASVSDINQPPELVSSTTSSGLYSIGTLTANQSISFGSQLTLTMQAAGNLVLYKQGSAVWSNSPTGPGGSNCSSACKMIFQSAGNLVLYQGSTPYWYNTTASNSGYLLKLSVEAPYISIVDAAGARKWPAFATYPISAGNNCEAVRTQVPG